MKASGASSRKRKSAALGSIDAAPAPVALEAPNPLPAGGGGDDRGAGEEGEGADRLSSLSNDLLREIISFLTTKEAARTGILASRWRDLWLSAPLNLDCRDLTSSGIVSDILSSHHGPVRRLYATTDDTVEACLRSAALDNLEELDCTYYRPERSSQPHRALIFRIWRTLRVANIGRCDLSDVSFFHGLHFPLLKQLGLVGVTISECSMHTLIAGCPVMECLLVYMTIGVRCLRLNSLTIRTISLLSNLERHVDPIGRIRLEQVIIENAPCLLRLLLLYPRDKLDVSVVAAPKLETLGFIGNTNYWNENSTIVFGSTVIKGLHVDKLITVVQSVKILSLGPNSLTLDTVIELMRCFPCVQKLYIEPYQARPSNSWRRKYRNLIGSFGMCLKKIVLERYRGLKSQVNFITFFVLNVNLLESVTLGIDDQNNNEEFFAEQHMKLQIENGASKDVRLHFTTDSCVGVSYSVTDVRDYDLTDPFACI